MPQPQAYERQTDFTERDGDDTDHAALNQELDAAALSIEGIRDNLALIQNDDGGLKNAVVTPESLAPETFTALQGDVAGAVAEAEAAAQSALTSATTANTARDQAVAAATAAQTSQTATALNAGTASTAAGAASASQTAAAASAAAALVSENNADASEAAALASANAGAVSAAAALADKNAAAASAAAALASANGASASATTATTQAGTATTQAGIATVQAGIATTKAADAAASAAAINLPASMVGKLLNFLRVKADESGHEYRTPAQVLTDLGVGRRLAQIVTFQTGAYASGATVVPYTDNVPTQTQGDQYMSLAITPTDALSTLEIDVVLHVSSGSAVAANIAALFQDATANALKASVNQQFASSQPTVFVFKHVMVAGTTASTTFKVRAGPVSAATMSFNGASGGRTVGGSMASSITIKEYLP